MYQSYSSHYKLPYAREDALHREPLVEAPLVPRQYHSNERLRSRQRDDCHVSMVDRSPEFSGYRRLPLDNRDGPQGAYYHSVGGSGEDSLYQGSMAGGVPQYVGSGHHGYQRLPPGYRVGPQNQIYAGVPGGDSRWCEPVSYVPPKSRECVYGPVAIDRCAIDSGQSTGTFQYRSVDGGSAFNCTPVTDMSAPYVDRGHQECHPVYRTGDLNQPQVNSSHMPLDVPVDDWKYRGPVTEGLTQSRRTDSRADDRSNIYDSVLGVSGNDRWKADLGEGVPERVVKRGSAYTQFHNSDLHASRKVVTPSESMVESHRSCVSLEGPEIGNIRQGVGRTVASDNPSQSSKMADNRARVLVPSYSSVVCTEVELVSESTPSESITGGDGYGRLPSQYGPSVRKSQVDVHVPFHALVEQSWGDKNHGACAKKAVVYTCSSETVDVPTLSGHISKSEDMLCKKTDTPSTCLSSTWEERRETSSDLDKVRIQFGLRPRDYREYFKLLNDFDEGEIDSVTFLKAVSTLFSDKNHGACANKAVVYTCSSETVDVPPLSGHISKSEDMLCKKTDTPSTCLSSTWEERRETSSDLDKVRIQFGLRPRDYREYFKLLNDFDEGEIDSVTFLKAVSTLFSDLELLIEFQKFLNTKYEARVLPCRSRVPEGGRSRLVKPKDLPSCDGRLKPSRSMCNLERVPSSKNVTGEKSQFSYPPGETLEKSQLGYPQGETLEKSRFCYPPGETLEISQFSYPPGETLEKYQLGYPQGETLEKSRLGYPPGETLEKSRVRLSARGDAREISV